MLNVHQISNAVADVSADRVSVEEFERWLRKGSRNVHACGDDALLSAVLSIESVLSEYRFGDMDEGKVKEELANAVRPFAFPSCKRLYGNVFVLDRRCNVRPTQAGTKTEVKAKIHSPNVFARVTQTGTKTELIPKKPLAREMEEVLASAIPGLLQRLRVARIV